MSLQLSVGLSFHSVYLAGLRTVYAIGDAINNSKLFGLELTLT